MKPEVFGLLMYYEKTKVGLSLFFQQNLKRGPNEYPNQPQLAKTD